MSAEEQVLKLFEQHHKPFNVQQIIDWLAQFGVKKAQIQKALDALVESSKIVAKVPA
jgi:Fe2+ or Zn2+ uptake regulation protein